MFNIKDAYKQYTKDDILLKLTEEQIFRYYCPNFINIDQKFLSEFYNDTKPSCYIYYRKGKLQYKDHGEPDHVFDCFGYVSFKYNLDFKQTIDKICSDFNISKIKVNINSRLISQPTEKTKIKNKYYIEIQPFNITDHNYWLQYNIDLQTLLKYNVHSCRRFVVTKNEKIIVSNYTHSNPMYLYIFEYDNSKYYKLYKPLDKPDRKWLFTGTSRCLEGFSNLPDTGDLLILTKSLKDVMVYKTLGYNAISLSSEHGLLANDTLDKLKLRFNKILVNFDNDKHGIKVTEKFTKNNNLSYFYIPEYKDVSDYIKNKGKYETIIMLNNEIKNRL